MNFIYRNSVALLFVIASLYLCFNFRGKIDQRPVIVADGLGYYTYLPTKFIYNKDYSYAFFDSLYGKKYFSYFDPPRRNFCNRIDSIEVNKYFPGVSLMQLPFFLAGHAYAKISAADADGYSAPYHYAIGFCGIFYACAGLLFLKKILQRFSIDRRIILLTLAGIFLGTNLFFYAAIFSSFSHVYLFCLISALLYFSIEFYFTGSVFAGSFLFFLLCMIFTIRPQDILLAPFLLLCIPFSNVWKKTKSCFSYPGFYLFLLAGLLVVFRMLWLWKIQTGKWLLNPYAGEHFYFDNPHLLDFLFSFRKGWLLYTPLCLISLFGIFFLPTRRVKIVTFLFFFVVVYVNSSWWIWTYGPTSVGQRVMVDYYGIIAVLLAILLNGFRNKFVVGSLSTLIVLCIALNQMQIYQWQKGIIQSDMNDKEHYLKNFFRMRPVAQFLVPENSFVFHKEYTRDYEEVKNNEISDSVAYSGKLSVYTGKQNEYAGLIEQQLPAEIKFNLFSYIRMRAQVMKTTDTSDAQLVVEIRGGEKPHWQSFGVSNYVQKNKWDEVEFGLEIPANFQAGDTVRTYFWDTKRRSLTFFDDFTLEFIQTDGSYDFKQ